MLELEIQRKKDSNFTPYYSKVPMMNKDIKILSDFYTPLDSVKSLQT